jgi:hypothetical protein
MAQLETKTISFHQVTSSYPARSEIAAGVYALSKMSGDWVRIPRDCTSVSPCLYCVYAPVSAFPAAASSPYGERYADLVKAKDILKADRYGYDSYETAGKAIGLIKRFLETHAKTR